MMYKPFLDKPHYLIDMIINSESVSLVKCLIQVVRIAWLLSPFAVVTLVKTSCCLFLAFMY